MSNYKYPAPQLLLKAICDTIRAKTSSNDKIPHQNIPDELDSIITEEECEIAARELSNIIYGSEVKVLDSKYILNIARYKFYGSGLTTVNLPKCTSIGGYAFQSCTSLTTIDLPKCTSIDYSTFNNCTSLTTIDLPECTSIGDNVFYHCDNLTTIDLPKCTSIGGYAFQSCTSLTTIDLPECTSIGDNAFENCTNLTTIVLPKCTYINCYAFKDCTNLTTVNLPKCTSIKDMAFNNCTSLTTVDLSKCTSIGYSAFSGCTNLTTIILSNNQVVTLGATNVFRGSGISRGSGYIYVPDNLVDSYKTATNWSSTYANQIKPLSELPSNLKEEYGYD